MTISHRIWAPALLAPLAFCAAAQPGSDSDTVVVTASRVEQRVRDSIPHTTIITANQIRESGAVDLPTLLRREAGFEFSQTGGIGTTSSTFLRGAGTNQVLVLIDGVRVSSLTTGATQLDQLMLDQIDRVEIVRGNVSSLYGSGAIGGVIQVFTRDGHGAPRAQVDVGLGEQGTTRLRAGVSGERGDTRFSFNVSHYATNGFSAIDPAVSPSVNPDRDGYRNLTFSGNLAQRFAPGQEAGVRFLSSNGRVDFDNVFAASPNDVQRGTSKVGSFLAYTNNRLASRWLSKLSYSEGRDEFAAETNGTVTSRTRTRNSQISWQNDFLLAPEHTATVGLEHLRQRVESSTAYAETERDVDAVFLGYVGRFGKHAVQLNLRSEHYSDFGSVNTDFIGYGYDVTPEWRLVASSARAFRAPTFNELFFPFFGNPNLRPERSRSFEAGVQYAAGPHLARLVVFHSRIEDLINPFPIANVDEATVDGVELSYSGTIAGTEVRASLTVQDPVQQTAATTQQLIRRSKAFGSLSVARRFGPWRLGGELLASERRLDNDIVTFTRTGLAAYQVVNLTASYRLSEATSFLARLDNAFDEKYQLAQGFNTQRRKLSALMQHQF